MADAPVILVPCLTRREPPDRASLPDVVQARYADHLANLQRISGSSIYPAIQNVILACRALGDAEAADAELEPARETFLQLGANPDAAHVKELLGRRGPGSTLTARETDVIRLVASGKTNRAIATTLRISEKTVARHLSNIFTKLGVSNRAAATAYAHEHGLMSRST